VRLSRCEVRDHINYRKHDRWRSHRFYRALQRLKSPMRYICEIFRHPRFSSFSTQSAADIEIIFGIITVGLSFASKVTRTRSASRQQAVDG
jgi:hypothetical protein